MFKVPISQDRHFSNTWKDDMIVELYHFDPFRRDSITYIGKIEGKYQVPPNSKLCYSVIARNSVSDRDFIKVDYVKVDCQNVECDPKVKPKHTDGPLIGGITGVINVRIRAHTYQAFKRIRCEDDGKMVEEEVSYYNPVSTTFNFNIYPLMEEEVTLLSSMGAVTLSDDYEGDNEMDEGLDLPSSPL